MNEFTGQIRLTSKLLSDEVEVSLGINEEKVYNWNIMPKGSIGGIYSVQVEVLYAGSDSETESWN